MAAEVLAAAGHDVTVYDQRRSPARKLVLAGRGGLNITHSEPLEVFLDRYGPQREYLEPAIQAFPPDALREWCSELDQPTFVGTSGRVFPQAFRAVPLLRRWLHRLESLNVEFRLQHRWDGWNGSDLVFMSLAEDRSLVARADHTVLALGGSSWPTVGGDGSWVGHVEGIGVDVAPLAPANCGLLIDWSTVMRDRFAGHPVKNVSVRAGAAMSRGDVIITSTGVEGGPIYAISRAVREQLGGSTATVTLDLWPDLEVGALTARLNERRRRKDSASTWLRKAGFSPAGVSLLRESTGNDIPSDAIDVAALSKDLPFTVRSMQGIDRAISSAGGIRWPELDEHFRLRARPNVSVIGEMLDWEAPTGGYLLQAVLSTARWAARAID